MAKEWYLLDGVHDQVSGYESGYFDSFAQDGFIEALGTSVADTVELYNYDLSQKSVIQVFVENRSQDTKLQSLRRIMMSQIGLCHAGMYVKYKNRFWLIENLVDDNGMYEKSVIVICNWKLQWLNDNGKLIQRWCNVSSASQYNNGETAFTNLFVRSNQLLVILPDDSESLLLKSGKRFIIDKRCYIYEKSIEDGVANDLSNEVMVYKLTRADSVIYNYVTDGHHEFLVSQCEQSADDGYYVIGDEKCWLCKSNAEIDDGTTQDTGICKIEYDTNIMYIGVSNCSFTAKFFNESGEEVSLTPNWNVACGFKDKLVISVSDDVLYISSNDESIVNKSLSVELSCEGLVSDSVVVYARAFL